jgi:membrane associated rhomboid family serine protease
MQEHSTEAAATGGMILKTLASAGVVGAFAGAVGFLFLWPKDRKEGFARIFFSGLSSHYFGEWVVRTVANFAEWIPLDDVRPGAYMLAGLFGWFIGAAVFKYFSKGKDIQEIAKDVKDLK